MWEQSAPTKIYPLRGRKKPFANAKTRIESLSTVHMTEAKEAGTGARRRHAALAPVWRKHSSPVTGYACEVELAHPQQRALRENWCGGRRFFIKVVERYCLHRRQTA